MKGAPNYITPAGYKRLREEYEALFAGERPKLVETIAWAAGNGDRSENGDYIYGQKRLREIDRRLTYLSKVMKQARIIDPAAQVERDVVHFGATIELSDEAGARRTMMLVGEDEADAMVARINWRAPIARALIGARVGNERLVSLPAGEKSYEVIAIRYAER